MSLASSAPPAHPAIRAAPDRRDHEDQRAHQERTERTARRARLDFRVQSETKDHLGPQDLPDQKAHLAVLSKSTDQPDHKDLQDLQDLPARRDHQESTEPTPAELLDLPETMDHQAQSELQDLKAHPDPRDLLESQALASIARHHVLLQVINPIWLVVLHSHLRHLHPNIFDTKTRAHHNI